MPAPEERPRVSRPYRGGGKWNGRGNRRLRHEALRDNREQERSGRGKVDPESRELTRLLEDWAGEDGSAAEGELDE